MKNRGGFTIIETLITLAISSGLFVAVMVLFSGNQGKVEFNQGLRDIDSQLRTVVNEVRNGYFPRLSGVSCRVNGGVLEFFNGDKEQGANNDCVFVGKAIYFDNSSVNNQNIDRYTIAGKRSATTTADLKPALVKGETISGAAYDSIESYKMPVGITLVNSSGAKIYAALAIMYDLDAISSLSSGSASITVKNLILGGGDLNSVSSSVSSGLGASANFPLVLCFKSATSNQYGTITINKSVSGIGTTVLISNNISGAGCING